MTEAAGHPNRATAATVVTASDGVHEGTREDRSGDLLAERLAAAGYDPVRRLVVPDDRQTIASTLQRACEDGARLVVVTGGTGLGPRDVTPEAVRDVTARTVPGIGEVMRAAGRASTPLADLSRSVAAAHGGSLVVAVPGSPAGAQESLEAVIDLVPHALDLLAGDTGHADGPSPAGGRGPRDAPVHGDPGHVHDETCAVAHGEASPDDEVGTLMAVFASPLAALLLAWGRELGYRTVLVDPRVAERDAPTGPTDPDEPGPMPVAASVTAADATTDLVVTDHHRDELVDLLDQALDTDARFIGLMGSARHAGPHVEPLQARGRTPDELDRIVRPIGFDIGSRTPAEIAIATLADLIARRRRRR